MNSLGIYFGPNTIYIIETKAKRIVNKVNVSLPALSSQDTEGKGSEEKIIVTLLEEALRKNSIGTKLANLTLPGKDLIIRTFEMPIMPREELRGAINFEVKKYIPFKTEDLISDFQVSFDKLSRTNVVLYIGIKKETLSRYIKIFNKLNIKITNMEYSAFSILRLLKIAKSDIKQTTGILTLDLSGEDEVNFVVLDNKFPVFSRDIVLSASVKETKAKDALSLDSVLEKLKGELRVSLDYFRRKFPEKHTKNLLIFCEQNEQVDLENLFQELGLTAKIISLEKYVDINIPQYIPFVKGYSCSLYKNIKTRFSVDLLAIAERKPPKEKVAKANLVSLIKSSKLDFRVVILCIFIILLVYGFGIYRILPLRNEVDYTIGQHNKLFDERANNSYENLISLNKGYTYKLSKLNGLVQTKLYFTDIMNILPSVMPEGMWLTGFNYREYIDTEGNKSELSLEGNVYLGQSDKEFKAVGEFISLLKDDHKFAEYFPRITINSLKTGEYANQTVTFFEISCKNY